MRFTRSVESTGGICSSGKSPTPIRGDLPRTADQASRIMFGSFLPLTPDACPVPVPPVGTRRNHATGDLSFLFSRLCSIRRRTAFPPVALPGARPMLAAHPPPLSDSSRRDMRRWQVTPNPFTQMGDAYVTTLRHTSDCAPHGGPMLDASLEEGNPFQYRFAVVAVQAH